MNSIISTTQQEEISKQTMSVNALTLSFSSSLESDFLSHYYQVNIGQIRLNMFVAFFFYALFGILDVYSFPEYTKSLWLIRYGLITPIIVLILLLSYTRFFEKWTQPLIAFAVITVGFGIIAKNIIVCTIWETYYAGILLVLLFGYTMSKARFLWSTLSGWCIVVLYIIAIVFVSPNNPHTIIYNIFLLFITNLLGMYSSYWAEYYARQGFYVDHLLTLEHEKVVLSNQELELRVKDRTSQLIDSNLALINEIEERKNIEKKLREREEYIKTIWDATPTGIILVHNKSQTVVDINEFAASFIGINKKSLIGMSIHKLFCISDSFSCIDITETKEPQYFEYHLITSRGEKVMVLLSVFPFVKENENYLIVSFIDISARKQIENALKTSEEKYRTIIENIEQGYYEVDLEGNFTFFNDTMCQILGYNRVELSGMNYKKITTQDQSEKMSQKFSEVLNEGKSGKGIVWEICRKDGQMRQIGSSVSLVRNAEGKIIGFRGIASDITDRKRMEALEKEKMAAEMSSHAKSEFLANMSHEIRTPLNGIIGMAEIADDSALDDNHRNIIHTIQREANALLGIVNDILDFSKIESGRMEIEAITFNLRRLMEEISDGMALRAGQKSIEFALYLDPSIPDKLIGDPSRLRQIIMNLTSNALKFTNEGDILLSGELLNQFENKITVKFCVKDTGIGIAKENQSKIFQSFSQADSTTSRKYGGTGLGTSISKNLTELMGGEIGLESIEGKGSTFWFTIVFERLPESEYTMTKTDLNGIHVMIVDDNEISRWVISQYLHAWNCHCFYASSATEAVELLNQSVSNHSPINLIIVNARLPEMTVCEFAKTIGKINGLLPAPFITLKSVGRKNNQKSYGEWRIEGFLTKPIRKNDLLRSIALFLNITITEDDSDDNETDGSTFPKGFSPNQRKQFRILLAEDYPTNQQVAMRHLKSAGFEVDLAQNGKEAFEAFKKKTYHLIFMDIQMPIMDGYEATRAIRADETKTQIPIIAMTAHAITKYRQKCFDAGMNDYITKPLKRTQLIATADKWCSTKISQYSIMDQPIDKPNNSNELEQTKDNIETEDPIDFKTAIEEFEGDKELVYEVLSTFIENVASQIGLMRQAINDQNTELIRKEAHSIKGGAANIVAKELSRTAYELEKSAKNAKLSECSIRLLDLEKSFMRLKLFSELHDKD